MTALHPSSRTPLQRWLVLAGFVALCLAVAALGSVATTPNIPDWYASLNKPSFTPPNWLFGPVWTTLYVMMAVAAWRVWQQPEEARRTRALTLFALQLAVNLAWSWLFFGMRWPVGGAVDIVALWVLVALTLGAFWRLDRVAGALFVPYLAWISYAAALNFAIVGLN